MSSSSAASSAGAFAENPFGLAGSPYVYRELTAHCAAFVDPLGLSSVGVITTDEGLVIVDSTIHPYFMTEILAELRARRTDDSNKSKPILHVINTHFHRDHTLGNRCIRPARGILAHRLCDEYQRRYLPNWLAEDSSDTFRNLELAPPDATFDGDYYVVPELSLEVAILQTGGHTHDSCLVHVPADGVVFSGDTMFNRVPPYVAHWSCVNHFGKITEWIESLELIAKLAPTHIVPGHGEIAQRDEVDGLKRFFEYYLDVVESGVKRGDRLKDIWAKIHGSANFQRRELEADVYLHMTMALHDELTGPGELFEK